MPPRRCRATGKIRFRDEIAAKLALADIWAKDSSGRAKTEQRAYRCTFCGGDGWHLTSQPQRTKLSDPPTRMKA